MHYYLILFFLMFLSAAHSMEVASLPTAKENLKDHHKINIYPVHLDYETPNQTDLYHFLDIQSTNETLYINSIFTFNYAQESKKYCHTILNGLRYIPCKESAQILIFQEVEKAVICAYKRESQNLWWILSNKMFLPLYLLPKLRPRQSALYKIEHKEVQTEHTATLGKANLSWPQQHLKIFTSIIGISSCMATLGLQWLYKKWAKIP